MNDNNNHPIRLQTLVVTGSSGFLGRNLVEWLTLKGYNVKAISRRSIGSISGKAHMIKIDDYYDVSTLTSYFAGSECVIHLAARAHIRKKKYSEKEMQAIKRANVDIALACADAAVRAGCQRFVFVSSIGVNGQATYGVPFTENDEPSPEDFYSFTKWLAECALSKFFCGTKVELVVVRPPLVYGPHSPGNFGMLISLVRFLPMHPFRALNSKRSYIGISNLCSALEVAAFNPRCGNKLFLVSDGNDIEFSRLVGIIFTSMGKSNIPELDVPKKLLNIIASILGQKKSFLKLTNELLVDSRLFKETTGWRPPYTIEKGISSAVISNRINSTSRRK